MVRQLQLGALTYSRDLCGAMGSGMGVANSVPPKLRTLRPAGLVRSTTKKHTSIGAAMVHDGTFMPDAMGG